MPIVDYCEDGPALRAEVIGEMIIPLDRVSCPTERFLDVSPDGRVAFFAGDRRFIVTDLFYGAKNEFRCRTKKPVEKIMGFVATSQSTGVAVLRHGNGWKVHSVELEGRFADFGEPVDEGDCFYGSRLFKLSTEHCAMLTPTREWDSARVHIYETNPLAVWKRVKVPGYVRDFDALALHNDSLHFVASASIGYINLADDSTHFHTRNAHWTDAQMHMSHSAERLENGTGVLFVHHPRMYKILSFCPESARFRLHPLENMAFVGSYDLNYASHETGATIIQFDYHALPPPEIEGDEVVFDPENDDEATTKRKRAEDRKRTEERKKAAALMPPRPPKGHCTIYRINTTADKIPKLSELAFIVAKKKGIKAEQLPQTSEYRPMEDNSRADRKRKLRYDSFHGLCPYRKAY